MAVKFLTREELDELSNELSEKLKEEEHSTRLLKQEVVMHEERIIKLEKEVERLNRALVKHEEIIQAHTMALDNKGVI